MSPRRSTPAAEAHDWEFKPRFRRNAFGWRSQPAIARVKQAVSEIKKVAKNEPLLGAEGAILFLERVSPALAHVDSSSGAIGSAVNSAIETLVPIIAKAPADARTRESWLKRLFDAYQDDDIPYIESLGDHWGALCASKSVASAWADQLIEGVKLSWSRDERVRGYFKGTTNCLSALIAAGRHDEVLALLELEPYRMWHYRQFGVQALVAKGSTSEAIRYAEEGRHPSESPVAIARACESLLLSTGEVDEAYRRYGLEANQRGTYPATFRAVAKRYPHKPSGEVLADLLQTTPGNEGKWFAAAKEAGLFDEALALATRSPCDPMTLARAGRDHEEKRPAFAVEAGLLSLHWLLQGYGYEITGLDVLNAYASTMAAAERNGNAAETKDRVRALVAAGGPGGPFVTKMLGRELGL